MITHDEILTQNRARFEVNRVVYIIPSGMHTAYDISLKDLNNLLKQLEDEKFTIREHVEQEHHTTSDWFKQSANGNFESYVITIKK
jgi:uncharacterized radical SAM superfamily protein